MGGLPRRATFLKRESEDGLPTLLLDAGGLFSNTVLSGEQLALAVRKGKLILTAMKIMGYRAAAVAETDLYLGRENLEELTKSAEGIAFLSANIKDAKGRPVFTPSLVVTVAGARVGIFGLASREVDPNLISLRFPGAWIDDPRKAAAETIGRLRNECDLVIVLSHLGFGHDRDLAQKVPGIDLIIGGRSNTWLKNPLPVGNTILCASFFEGRAVGKLILSTSAPGGRAWASGDRMEILARQVEAIRANPSPLPAAREALAAMEKELDASRQRIRYDGTMVDMDGSFPDDPRMAEMIRTYREELAREAASKPPSAADTGGEHYAGDAICRDCHLGRWHFWVRTSHARAYSTLTRRGTGADPDCLPCHVTGFLRPTGYAPATPRPYLTGVQCEACHGMGGLHTGAPGIYGLIRTPPASVCRMCHIPPRDEQFDYAKSRGKVCSDQAP